MTPERLLRLGISGSCPGGVTIRVSGAAPGDRVPMMASPALGSFTLPAGPCAGTVLDLADPKLLGVLTADSDGNVSRAAQAPPGSCGAYLQAMDVGSCSTTNVGQVS